MSSAIRFSGSRSQSSHSTTATTSRHDAAVPGRAPPAFQHHRAHMAEAAEGSEGFQELPSSIPSAPSPPPSQGTKTTTTSSSGGTSKSRSDSHSQSRRSVSQPTPEAGAANYPWSYPFPPPFPYAAPTAAAAAVAQHTSERDESYAGRKDKRQRSAPRRRSTDPPPPCSRQGTFPFSLPNIPWIPPPPIHGLPALYVADVNDGYAPTYPYAHLTAHPQHQQRFNQDLPNAIKKTTTAAAARASSPSLGLPWPAPEQLPLPSTFPMPPRTLPPQPTADLPPSQHPGSHHNLDLFPPPPLPPWWFLQAMGLPSFPPFNKPRSSSGSRDSESDSDSGDSDRESSSSTSSYSPPRREWAAPHTPPHRHQQQPKRFAAPVGSVETPTPIPRGGTGGSRGNNSTGNRTNSSTQTTADSTAASATSAAAQRGKQVKHAQTGPLHTTVSPPVRPVRRRALPSSERTESLHEEHRPRHEIHSANAVPFSRQRHAAPPDSAVQIYTDANKVVAAGEDGGAEVTEEEDRRVQRVLSTAEAYLARIEDLYHRLRHRYEEVLLSPVKGDEELTGSGPPRKHPATPECRSEDDDGGNLGYPQPRRIPPSEQRYAAAPTRPPSQAASPASPTSAPLSLRHELARLESQWQRLEELKRRGIGAGAGAPFVPSSSLQPSFSSALSTTAPAPALSASSRQPARGDTVLSNQSVMELINDRKHLLTSAA